MKITISPVFKIVLTILGICFVIFGGMGFMISTTYNVGTADFEKYYKPLPLNDKNGIAIDSSGDIYIGEGESESIQVYDNEGNFKYGFCFPTGGAGWFAFGIDRDRIHIVTARTDSYFVFDKGNLVYSEGEISYNHSKELQEKYNMSDQNSFIMYDKTYVISNDNTICIKDKISGEVKEVHLKVPIWPFSIDTFWSIGAFGMGMIFVLHYKFFFSIMK